MNLTLHPYRLEFVFPFRIAHGMRTHTDTVFVELELDGVHAFGEATLPPYLPYSQASTMEYLSQVDLSRVSWPFDTRQVLSQIKTQHRSIEPPALAALDMALWTLEAKKKETTISSLLGINKHDTAIRTYTISVCDKVEMAERIAYGKERGFHTFKLKLNGVDDRQMLSDFRSLSDAPFAVDANQSWTDLNESIVLGSELLSLGCILIEQPFHRDDIAKTLQLKNAVGLPIIADEAVQGLMDIGRIEKAFSGINVKLQKCGGISEANKIMTYARALRLKTLIGCMSESTIGCDAAETLSPICEWNDLDGRYLVKEVPFKN